jgi:AraC-like DNA-binding protein
MDVHPDHLKRLTEVAGVDPSDWVRDAELRECKRIPLPRLYDLLEHLASERSTPTLGLELAARTREPLFEPVEGVCRRLSTLGDAIECWMENHPVVAGSQSLSFETFGGTAMVDITVLGRWREAHDHVVDLFLTRQCELIREANGGEARPRLVQLTRERDGTRGEHADYFGCETEFSAQRNRLVFEANMLEEVLSDRAPKTEAERALEKLAEQRRAVTSQDIVRKIRRVLAQSPTPQSMSLKDVADSFDVSARTLQRRMRATGETLRRIRDDVQKEQVRCYIKEGKSFDEIADLLGYSELSAFYRAFKRWFGVTPAAFRRSVSNGE